MAGGTTWLWAQLRATASTTAISGFLSATVQQHIIPSHYYCENFWSCRSPERVSVWHTCEQWGNEERVRSTVALKLAVTDSKQQLPRDRRDRHCCTRPERGGEAYTRGKSRRQEGRAWYRAREAATEAEMVLSNDWRQRKSHCPWQLWPSLKWRRMFDSSLTSWLSMEPVTEWGLTVGVRICFSMKNNHKNSNVIREAENLGGSYGSGEQGKMAEPPGSFRWRQVTHSTWVLWKSTGQAKTILLNPPVPQISHWGLTDNLPSMMRPPTWAKHGTCHSLSICAMCEI